MDKVYSDSNFEEMSWHDNSVYSISFPSGDLCLKFDIDYILEWILNTKTSLYEFVVAPASLVFNDVMNLNVSLHFADSIGLYIDEILRFNQRLSPNEKVYIWDYIIKTDKGEITFNSTGFTQRLEKLPQQIKSQRFETKE